MMRTVKKTYRFMDNRRYFWLASVVIMALGLIANILMGVRMDIRLTGGTMLRYSYPESGIVSDADVTASAQVQVTSDSEVQNEPPSPATNAVIVSGDDVTSSSDVPQQTVSGVQVSPGDVTADSVSAGDAGAEDGTDPADPVEQVLKDIRPDYSTQVMPDEAGRLLSRALNEDVTVQISTDATASSDGENKRLTVTFGPDHKISADTDGTIRRVLSEKYPNVVLTLNRTSSVDPAAGGEFLGRCAAAVVLAVAFMVLYVGMRFRSIGGWTAALSAVIAIIHDCLAAYFAFVLLRFPISDHFIAVVLAIIGHSLNSTIVIFDRIRENRRLMADSMSLAELTDRSVNESMSRTICTDLCVFMAAGVMAAVSAAAGMSSLLSFAVPMMFGVVSGSYSSLCISTTLWVSWQEHLEKRREASDSAEL